MSEHRNDPSVRHEFVVLYDVVNGNPNGDPDGDNAPRTDPETMHGIVTDVCIKRKVRNYVALTRGEEPGCGIYVNDRGIALNTIHREAYAEQGLDAKKASPEAVASARDWLCEHYWDIRTFGAVMSMKEANAGQVRGPVQLAFGQSIDPIVPMEATITRVAITKPEDAVQADGSGKRTEMGRKAYVPYALYATHGFFSPALAAQTGFGEKDLELLWEALARMFESDRSASRGEMACRGLHVFTHTSALGEGPAHRTLGTLSVHLREGVAIPRSFGDYEVTVNEEGLPEGVTHWSRDW